MSPLLAELVILAQTVTTAPVAPDPSDPTGGRGEEWGKAAPIGLLVIVLLCIAGYFLGRSLTKRIKRVPAEFGTDTSDSPQR